MSRLAAVSPLAALLLAGAGAPPDEAALRAEFERRYRAWREYADRPEIRIRSDERARTDNAAYAAIVALGPRAAPLVLEKLPESRFLGAALERMTARRLSPGERSEAASREGAVAVWRRWWGEGRRSAPERFAAAYREWREARRRGERLLRSEEAVLDADGRLREERGETALGRAFEGMRAPGIDALPWIADRIRAGDADLLPLFGDLTGGLGATGVGSREDRVRFSIEWWDANRPDWTLPDPPPAPDDLPLAPPRPSPAAPSPEPAPPAPPVRNPSPALLLAAAGLLAGLALGRLGRRRG